MDEQKHPALSLLSELSSICRIGHSILISHLVDRVGKYESEITALSLSMLAVRHAEGVASCGELGPSGFPPMAACGRSALEVGAVSAWLINADDPMDREGRWLGYYKAYQRYWHALAAETIETVEGERIAFEALGSAHEAWRAAIEAALPVGRVVLPPNFLDILTDLGSSSIYPAYRTASQLVHGAPPAQDFIRTVEYVREAGDNSNPFKAKSVTLSFGDFVHATDWVGPIRMGAFGVVRSISELCKRLTGTPLDTSQLSESYAALLLHTEEFCIASSL